MLLGVLIRIGWLEKSIGISAEGHSFFSMALTRTKIKLQLRRAQVIKKTSSLGNLSGPINGGLKHAVYYTKHMEVT